MKLVYTLAAAVVAVSASAAFIGQSANPQLSARSATEVNAQQIRTGFYKNGKLLDEKEMNANGPKQAAPRYATQVVGNVTITTNDNGIITDVSGVEPTIFKRSAGRAWTYDSQLFYSAQSGNVEIVIDGDNYYIKNPLSGVTTGAWIKGIKNGDEVEFAAGQPLSYSSDYGNTISLRWGSATNFGADNEHEALIKYSIDGDNLVLQGTSNPLDGNGGNIIGAYLDGYDYLLGYWEEGTILTDNTGYVPPSTDLVELPAGATVQNWYLNGSEHSNSGDTPIKNRAVKVAFVGDEVYISGEFVDFPTSWIKGTVNGSSIEFENFQYIGPYGTNNIWVVGYDYATDAMAAPTATYDATAQTITFNTGIVANAADDRFYYLEWINDAILSADEVVYVEQPVTDKTATLPYVNTFDTADEQADIAIVDQNGDGKTFSFQPANGGKAARYLYNEKSNADDYLVFPGIEFVAGKKYVFSFNTWAQSRSYPERLEVVCGTEPLISALTTTIKEATVINSANPQELSAEFTVEEDGVYYIAIHGISDADNYYLWVDDVNIYEKPMTTLAELKAEEAEAGDAFKIVSEDLVVTYINEDYGWAFVQDDTAAIILDIDPEDCPLTAGTKLNGTLSLYYGGMGGYYMADFDESEFTASDYDVTWGAALTEEELRLPENQLRLVTLVATEENPILRNEDFGMHQGESIQIADMWDTIEDFPASATYATGIVMTSLMFEEIDEETPVLIIIRSAEDIVAEEMEPYTVADLLDLAEYADNQYQLPVQDIVVTFTSEDGSLSIIEDETGAAQVYNPYANAGKLEQGTMISGTLGVEYSSEYEMLVVYVSDSTLETEDVDVTEGKALTEEEILSGLHGFRLVTLTHTEENPILVDENLLSVKYGQKIMIYDVFDVLGDDYLFPNLIDKVTGHIIHVSLPGMMDEEEDEDTPAQPEVFIAPRSINDILANPEAGLNKVEINAALDGAVYNLNGVKVADSVKGANLQKGVYIVNGKKLLVF